MTVQNTPVINKWTGNGTNKDFDFDFRIDNENQLRVSLLSDYDNPLVLGTDYRIKDIDEGSNYPLEQGTIEYPLSGSTHDVLTAEDKIVLELNIPYVQGVPFSQGGITASAIEECLDYNVRLMQRLKQDNEGYKENIETSIDNFETSITQTVASNKAELEQEIATFETQTSSTLNSFSSNIETFKTTVNGQIAGIQSEVNTANTNASSAVTTANSANTKADSAVSTANTANTNASNAVTTANAANTAAGNAVSTANSASTTATNASNKVDEFGEDIEDVLEAASKINELEQAVATAVSKAGEATTAATTANTKASEATTAAQTATQKAQEAQEAAESIVIPTTLSSFTDDLGSNPTHTHSQYITDISDLSGLANSDLSNLSATGEAKFANKTLSNIANISDNAQGLLNEIYQAKITGSAGNSTTPCYMSGGSWYSCSGLSSSLRCSSRTTISSTKPDMVIAQGGSGTSGYRVWSSGFKECWGSFDAPTTTTFNYTVTFSMGNYSFSNVPMVLVHVDENGHATGATSNVGLQNIWTSTGCLNGRTTSSFTLCRTTTSLSGKTRYETWYAFGY